jgi:acyl dehydratase
MILALRILYFEDLSVGMTETLSKTIAASDVVGFAQLTGDRNPIHLSEHFAASARDLRAAARSQTRSCSTARPG